MVSFLLYTKCWNFGPGPHGKQAPRVLGRRCSGTFIDAASTRFLRLMRAYAPNHSVDPGAIVQGSHRPISVHEVVHPVKDLRVGVGVGGEWGLK